MGIVQRSIFGLEALRSLAYMLQCNKTSAGGEMGEAVKTSGIRRAPRKGAAVATPIAKSGAPAPKTKVATKPMAELAQTITNIAPQPGDLIETVEAAPSPAPLSDIIITAADTAPISEGFEAMATATTKTAETVGITSDKLQAMFGDVGARFKASFEKSTKLGEEIADLTKGNVEAVVASARVAAKGSETLGQDAAEYGKKSLEQAVAVLKSFASAKTPTELFQLQSDFAKASFDSAVAEASKFSETWMKLAGDVAQPISTRYAVAADKIKAVAL